MGLVLTFIIPSSKIFAEKQTPIAVVDGTTIVVSESEIDALPKSQGPTTSTNPDARNVDYAHLAVRKIVDLARTEEMKEYGIVVTDVDADQYWQDRAKAVNVNKAVQDHQAQYRPLWNAVKAVYEENKPKEEAYRLYLMDRMDQNTWERMVVLFKDPVQREALRINAFMTVEKAMEKPANLKSIIASQRLDTQIDKLIAQDNPAYGKFLEAKQRHDLDALKNYSPQYQTVQRNKWWQKKYKSMKIEFLMPELEPKIKSLLFPEG